METNQVKPRSIGDPSEISTFLPPQSSPRQKKSWDRRPEEQRENHVERLNSGVVRLSQRLAERLSQKTDQQIPRCQYYEITSGTPKVPKDQRIHERKGMGRLPQRSLLWHIYPPPYSKIFHNTTFNRIQLKPLPHHMQCSFLRAWTWGHILYISLVPSVPLLSLHASPFQSAGPIRPSILSSSPACSVHKRLRIKENHMLYSHHRDLNNLKYQASISPPNLLVLWKCLPTNIT